MPLTMLNTGKSTLIRKVGGGDKTRQFLSSLGFNEGSPVTVVSSFDGNLIVMVKDARIAISKEMAMRIIV